MSPRLSHTSHSSHVSHTSHTSHIRATTEQIHALSLLKHESTTSILAYTRHARSLAHGIKQGAGNGLLSEEQLDAIDTLSSCREDEVRILLEQPHAPHDWKNCPGSCLCGLSPIPSSSGTLQRPISGPSQEVALSQQHTAYGARAQAPQQPLRPFSCTVCQRSYQNHFDWKKHEKEHEYTYTCGAIGHWDAKAQSFFCTHCGILNPGEEHLRLHGIEKCNIQNKRREKIVKHLKDHHMVSEKAVGESLANDWRLDQGKRFWACGFCVTLFLSFKDRLQHIGKDHYNQGQTLKDWDANKVIRGLLLQPMVHGPWKSLVDTHCFHNASELTWETSNLKDLQYKLEIGPTDERSGKNLAEVAYRASKMPPAQDVSEHAIDLSNGSQYASPSELSPTSNIPDNDISFKRLATSGQESRQVLAPAVSPFSDYVSSTPFYSGTNSQLRTPAEDEGIKAATTLLPGEGDDYQGWAIDPVLFNEPSALKDDDMMEFEYNAGQH